MIGFLRFLLLATLSTQLCSCSGVIKLNPGEVFETPGFFGVVDDEENGIWVSSKDGSTSALLLDHSAGLTFKDAWISVEHDKGKYKRHVVSRMIGGGKRVRVEDSGK